MNCREIALDKTFSSCWGPLMMFLQFFSTAYSHFFSQLYSQIQELYTQDASHLLQNIAQKQTFVLCCNNIMFWIYHINTVIQNLKLFYHELLCTFLCNIESSWEIHGKHESKIQAKLFFTVTKHLWLWIQYYTVQKKINTSTMCSCVDMYL